MQTGEIYQWGDIFRIVVPEKWTCEESEGVITLARVGGVGALNVSLVRMNQRPRDAKSIALQLAERFAANRGWDIGKSNVHSEVTAVGALSEFEYTEYGDESAYWQVWNVVGAEHAALITYTCSPDYSDVEATFRNDIVQSFRWANS